MKQANLEVLILSGNLMYARGLETCLAKRGFDVQSTFDSQAILEQMSQNRPAPFQVIVGPIGERSFNLFDICHKVASEPEIAQVIAVLCTNYSSDKLLQDLAAIGVSGHIETSDDCENVCRVIGRVAEDKSTFEAFVVEQSLLTCDELTEAEANVLCALTQPRTYAEIADQLDVSEYTVSNQVRSILSKLHVHSRDEAVARARRRGILSPS